LPADQGQKMHRLAPKSEFDMLSGCGHLAPLECAPQIGPRIVAFIRQ
jgi:pimeloyl-ACP methyl ester carboxylesterase